jgi:hypothetical protein
MKSEGSRPIHFPLAPEKQDGTGESLQSILKTFISGFFTGRKLALYAPPHSCYRLIRYTKFAFAHLAKNESPTLITSGRDKASEL